MPRRLLCSFIPLILSLFHPPASAEDFCGLRNTAWQSGETLRYKVYYNMGYLWAGAGEVVFTVKDEKMNGRTVHHISSQGSTYKSYDWFYKVRDLYETYIDAETMLPRKFHRKVQEGNTRFENTLLFDHARGRVVSDKGTHKIPACVQDVLSAIYYARNIDFSAYKAGDKIPFSMFLDEQVHRLYIRCLGRERVKTKWGTFNAIKFAPLLLEGTLFKGGEGMVVWVSDDANHIPVRIDSPISVGSVKVDLIGYAGLRHSFAGMVKKK